MRPGFSSRSLITNAEEMPDIVQWINLLSALCFTSMLTILGDYEIVPNAVFAFCFFGMILGSVVFVMCHGFCTMCGGKTYFWVSTGLFILLFLLLLWVTYSTYSLGWVI